MIIGVISDTHGLLRPQAYHALQGSELILHAGDIGKPEILASLEKIAPVKAVRGNMDTNPWAQSIPGTQAIETPAGILYMLHNLQLLDLDPSAAGFQAIIYGHSHQPAITHQLGILYLNPGSAGPRRFRLPVSIARLNISPNGIEAELVELKI